MEDLAQRERYGCEEGELRRKRRDEELYILMLDPRVP